MRTNRAGKLVNLYTQNQFLSTIRNNERASYNGSIEASQASDVGSIPIARSISPVDAVGFTGFPPRNYPLKRTILDAVGREMLRGRANWTRRFQVLLCTFGCREPGWHDAAKSRVSHCACE